MINKKRLIATAKRLIRFDSENPPGNERPIALWVGGYLRGLGLSVRFHEFSKGRPNVIGVLKGGRLARGLLLSPHLDTVPAGRGWRFDPFGGVVRNGRLYGRGGTDCKGNLASCLEAITSVVEDGLALTCDLTFAATADEETGSRFGIIPLIEKGVLAPRAAVILDGDDFDILVAQKGLLHFKVKVFGKRAHGAYPWRGVNAIEKSAEIIHRLKRLKFRFRRHPLLGPPTINIGTIKGGDKVNIVADHCEFTVDLRFLPGMDAKEIMSKIKSHVKAHAKRYTIEVESLQHPYEIESESPLVEALARALRGHGKRVKIKGSEGATVITFFKKKGIPAIGFGFGAKGQAHGTDEYVKVGDLYEGAKVLASFIKDFDAHC